MDPILSELIGIVRRRRIGRDAVNGLNISISVFVHEPLEPTDDVGQPLHALDHQDGADFYDISAGHDEFYDIAMIEHAVRPRDRNADLLVDVVDVAEGQRLGPCATDTRRAAEPRLRGINIDRKPGIPVGGGHRRGTGIFHGLSDFNGFGLVRRQLDDDGNVHCFAHGLSNIKCYLRILADHRSAMHAGHQRRVRATEIQFDHGEAAILNRAAYIFPSVDVFRTGAADQMGIAFAGVCADFLQVRNPVLVIGAGIAGPAVELKVARHLSLNNVAAVVHDRVFGVHG